MANPVNQDYMWLRNQYVPERYDGCTFEPEPRQLAQLHTIDSKVKSILSFVSLL